MGLDRPARSRIMEQRIVYVGLNLHMDHRRGGICSGMQARSCAALQGLKHAGAQAMPSSAPCAISLPLLARQVRGCVVQALPNSHEAWFEPRFKAEATADQSNHSRVGPQRIAESNSMPSAAALRLISWSIAESAPRWRQSSAIDMPNSPARSAHESATRASPTTVSRPVIVEVMSRVRVSRPLAAKARTNSDPGSSLAVPSNRL
jgi:hypothetical protein